jgi:hypothetical protein
MKLNKKYLLILILLLIIIFTSNVYGQTTGTMSVTVQVKENNAVNIQRTNDIVIGNLSTQQAKVIEKTDPSCCYCTQKYKDGTYIDEFKNSYLIDKSTNKPAINNSNKDTNRVIFCPQISVKK